LAIRFLMRWYAVHDLKGVRFGIFCEDYPALKDRQMSKARTEFPGWLGEWNTEDKEFRLRPEYGSGVIAFRNLDNPSKYLSAEFAGIGVDELTRNEVGVFNTLRGSLRWPGIEHNPFVACTNPGGPGHAWVKDIWVDGAFGLDDTKALVEPTAGSLLSPFTREDFAYVIARVSDNPHLPQSYMRQLESLPEKLRAAYLDGNWDAFDGQAFTEFDRDTHVQPMEPDDDWHCVGCFDWGYDSPAGALLLYFGPGERVLARHEFYGRRLKPHDLGARLATVIGHARACGHPDPDAIICDSQMWAAQSGGVGGKTIAELVEDGVISVLGETAPPLIPASKGPGSRIAGKQLVHEVLASRPDLGPALVIHPECSNLVRSLPTLALDSTNPEDVDTDGDDHLYDALRYALIDRLPLYRKPAVSKGAKMERMALDSLSRKEAESFDPLLVKKKPVGRSLGVA
jgi:hypothetical protein